MAKTKVPLKRIDASEIRKVMKSKMGDINNITKEAVIMVAKELDFNIANRPKAIKSFRMRMWNIARKAD